MPLMPNGEVVLRFNNVSFDFGHNKPILHEADFSVRKGSKITLMGQNGAGKTTIFQLIMGTLKPDTGTINIAPGATIATARQVIPRSEMGLTIREFFEGAFKEKIYNIDPRIDKVLDIVNLSAPHDRILKTLYGGQLARLLWAQALIQKKPSKLAS